MNWRLMRHCFAVAVAMALGAQTGIILAKLTWLGLKATARTAYWEQKEGR